MVSITIYGLGRCVMVSYNHLPTMGHHLENGSQSQETGGGKT